MNEEKTSSSSAYKENLEMHGDPMIHLTAFCGVNAGRRRRCGDGVSSTYEAVLHIFL